MNSNIRFVLSQKKDLLDQYFHIRYERYVEEMGAEKANSARLEIDSYDDKSYFIIILKGEEVIGGCRLIDGYLTKLPVEQFLLPGTVLKERRLEISRYTLKRNCGLSPTETTDVLRGCHSFIEGLCFMIDYSAYANARALCIRLQKWIEPWLKMKVIGPVNNHEGAGKLIPVMFSR